LKNKTILISFVVGVILVVGILGFAQNKIEKQTDNTTIPVDNITPPNNPTVNNTLTNNMQNHQNGTDHKHHGKVSAKNIDVYISIKAPKKAHQGQDVQVTYTIRNKGTKPIYNVIIDGQYVHKELGIIFPGKTVKCKTMQPIEKGAEKQFTLGGDALIFIDYNNAKNVMNFNFWKIKIF
jgi:hypothetical protein